MVETGRREVFALSPRQGSADGSVTVPSKASLSWPPQSPVPLWGLNGCSWELAGCQQSIYKLISNFLGSQWTYLIPNRSQNSPLIFLYSFSYLIREEHRSGQSGDWLWRPRVNFLFFPNMPGPDAFKPTPWRWTAPRPPLEPQVIRCSPWTRSISRIRSFPKIQTLRCHPRHAESDPAF